MKVTALHLTPLQRTPKTASSTGVELLSVLSYDFTDALSYGLVNAGNIKPTGSARESS